MQYTPCLTPTLARSARAGNDSSHQLQAALLLNRQPVIQIESCEPVPGAGSLELRFVPRLDTSPAPTTARTLDVRPPSRWGINE